MPLNHLYQYSLIGSLMQGVCEDGVSAAKVLTQGTHGLGTVSLLDGEIIVVDNEAYHFTSTGEVRTVAPTDTIPFAMMTDFRPTMSIGISALDLASLPQHVSPLLGDGKNYFLAVRVDGYFPSVTVRIIPKREKADEALGDLARRQTVRSLSHTRGTLFGFWSPEYTAGLSVVGFHLHYLSQDRRAGGHVLAFEAREAQLSAAVLEQCHLELPGTVEFRQTPIQVPELAAVESAEGW
ncbi:acetolactate decarboxylase [Aspergillus clavatus NRRL 1]|uniref:Alpha-acetolactate decarboxylase n=1 Tax=Aspergillus clavatus (strain ATCC 1007 / CBS 513.65 / DSM 816 / NCTC 3887 / NRRL 1 / QM 1276 / 107) TaxID=344612 RepID=A1CMZ3_ASPCL|nr:alpha-acetolactate decarboxylase, putative [Aspergillus clavatus NRRL 1]EAW08930.1 alpha-acetolactate decarboxylase, putative [Aspergillus clavatus NRRL 1]